MVIESARRGSAARRGTRFGNLAASIVKILRIVEDSEHGDQGERRTLEESARRNPRLLEHEFPRIGLAALGFAALA